jgi:hypothetical protein
MDELKKRYEIFLNFFKKHYEKIDDLVKNLETSKKLFYKYILTIVKPKKGKKEKIRFLHNIYILKKNYLLFLKKSKEINCKTIKDAKTQMGYILKKNIVDMTQQLFVGSKKKIKKKKTLLDIPYRIILDHILIRVPHSTYYINLTPIRLIRHYIGYFYKDYTKKPFLIFNNVEIFEKSYFEEYIFKLIFYSVMILKITIGVQMSNIITDNTFECFYELMDLKLKKGKLTGELFKYLNKLQKLSLDTCNVISGYHFKHLKNLKELTLINMTIPDKNFEGLKHLEMLKIEKTDFTGELFKYLKNLKILDIKNMHDDKNNDLFYGFKYLENHALILYINNLYYSNPLKYLRQLKKLYFSHKDIFDLKYIFPNNIKELTFEGIDDFVNKKYLEKMEKLEKLTLITSFNMTIIDIKKIPNLTHLEIKGRSSILTINYDIVYTDDDFKDLKITHLTIDNPTDKFTDNIFKYLKGLKGLEIKENRDINITDKAFVSLENLEYLYLHHTKKISIQIFDYLKKLIHFKLGSYKDIKKDIKGTAMDIEDFVNIKKKIQLFELDNYKNAKGLFDVK